MPTDPYRYFRIEARELTDQLAQGVLALEKIERADRPSGVDAVAKLLRVAHTLKGAARVVKQRLIAENAHAIEGLLEPFRDGQRVAERQEVDELLRLVDEISAQVAVLEGPPAAKPAESEKGAPEAGAPASGDEPVGMARASTAETDALVEGVLETGVHLRAVRSAVGALAAVRHLTDSLVQQLGTGDGRDATGARAGPSIWKVRGLAADLRALVEGTERGLSSGVDQAERELEQVRDAAERLRLVPASALFPTLARTVRDAAHVLGSRVEFVGKGGDVRVEAHVLAELQGALVQIMRNAVAHGIEAPAERARAGKPAVGTVEISVQRRGSRVACVCRDDGRGIETEKVRAAAEKAGLVSREAGTLTAEQLLSVLMKGGLSTSGAVTEVAGRGIGLDVVREVSARLGGLVTLTTEAGRGTTLELVVPVSLTSLDVLLLETGGGTVAIPLEAVQRTLRLAAGDVVRTAEGDSVVYDGHVVPFAPLARAVASTAAPVRSASAASAASVVVVRGRGASAAVSVDRLLGTANIVVRPLPALAVADATVAGVSLDGGGMPRLVLDPEGLVSFALGRRRALATGVSLGDGARAGAAAVPVVLVIDDSLTTRALEQSILESAGYEVDLATSAEEGLEKAGGRRYALFLVDVEMPGMDGFTFVERTRAHPVLRDTPAILVSSRNAPEDLQRGRDVGARAYVVKGEFDQARLLATIRELLSS